MCLNAFRVGVLLSLMINFSLMAQPSLKYPDVSHEVARYTSISTHAPSTSVNLFHYLLTVKDSRKLPSMIKIVKRISPDKVIVNVNPEIMKQNAFLFESVSPVNYLWKLAPGLETLSSEEEHNFTIKTSSAEALIDDVRTLKNVKPLQIRNNTIVLHTSVDKILNHIITLDHVQYAGKESYLPTEESTVLDLNLGANAINRIHHEYPSYTGNGLTISIKELDVDPEDIDIIGRHKTSTTQAGEISIHATDMATIATGAGNSFITGKGVAPAASVASSTFRDLFPDSNEELASVDASVQNHSYGTEIENFYGAMAEAYNQSTHQNPIILHCFSSGNKGTSSSTLGLYKDLNNFANITGNFKMSKNTLTVGAADTTGKAVSLSSRGPAYDGRIKPELVAYSSVGTSNSSALVAGVALVLQQIYKEDKGSLPPSALVKSILINSASEAGVPGLDFITGYGNLNSYRAVSNLKNNQYLTGMINPGGSQAFALTIPANAKNLKITLAWNDPAAILNSNIALVNDLNMKLEFSGNEWLPWILDPSPSASSLSKPATRGEDHLNNVEQISLTDPAQGTYTITINGGSVLSAPQEFFIAYQWDAGNQFEWSFPTGSDNMPYNGETISYFYWHSTLPETTGSLEYSIDQGMTWNIIAPSVNLSAGYYRWNHIPDITAKAQARMVVGGATFETDVFTISRPLTVSTGFNCGDSVMIQWPKKPNATTYNVFAFKDNSLNLFSTVSDTFYIFKKQNLTSPYFSVQPVISQKPGIKSPTFDYQALGTNCFVYSFIDEIVPAEGVYLSVELGTTYSVDRLIFEHQSTGAFTEIGSVPISGDRNIRFLDSDPAEGYNRYRVRVQLQNGMEVITDTLENFYAYKTPFHVFPNPVSKSKELRIFSKTLENQEMTFKVYRNDGVMLINTTLLSDREFISLDELPPGLYLYTLTSQESTSKGKLIVTP